jgi:hypothetical protein
MDVWKGGLALLLVCSGTRSAHAEPRTDSPSFLGGEAYSGWVEGRHSGGVLVGGSVRLGYRWLTAGLNLQGATVLLGSMASASALGGISARASVLRLDALAEVGVNGYTQVGSNFLSHDPGTSAVLPFAGGRAAALLRVVRRASTGAEIWVGPSVAYAHDLASTTHTYSYEQGSGLGLFGDSATGEAFSTVTVGQTSYSASLVVSLTLPL